MSEFNGHVLIENSKITVVNITDDYKEISDIRQLIALKNMIDEKLITFEKEDKRRL